MENIKLVCFDVNKTLIEGNFWYDLNTTLGVTPEDDRLYLNQYQSGIISYVEWMKLLREIYLKSPLANEEFITKISKNYKIKPAAIEVIKYLKSKNYEIVLISGSVDILVESVAKDLGIKHWWANNHFIFDENQKLLDIQITDDEGIAKANFLKKFCQELPCELNECVCVGDNDIMMFAETGHGIAFKDSDLITQMSAEKVIAKIEDLKNIL